MITKDEVSDFFAYVFHGDTLADKLKNVYVDKILPVIFDCGVSEEHIAEAFGDAFLKYGRNANSIEVSVDNIFYTESNYDNPREAIHIKNYIVIEYEHYYSGDTEIWQEYIPVNFFYNQDRVEISNWVKNRLFISREIKAELIRRKDAERVERKKRSLEFHLQKVDTIKEELIELGVEL